MGSLLAHLLTFLSFFVQSIGPSVTLSSFSFFPFSLILAVDAHLVDESMSPAASPAAMSRDPTETADEVKDEEMAPACPEVLLETMKVMEAENKKAAFKSACSQISKMHKSIQKKPVSETREETKSINHPLPSP